MISYVTGLSGIGVVVMWEEGTVVVVNVCNLRMEMWKMLAEQQHASLSPTTDAR